MCPFCGLTLYSRYESHGDHWIADCCQWGAMLTSGVEFKNVLLAAEAEAVEDTEDAEAIVIDIWANWPDETMDVRLQSLLTKMAEGVESQGELNNKVLSMLLSLRENIATGYAGERDDDKAAGLEKWLRVQL